MPTIQQVAAKLNAQCVDGLIRNVKAMPDDKVSWQPLDAGRSGLDQLQECAIICGMATAVLKAHAFPADFQAEYGRQMAEIDTIDRAVTRLKENSAALELTILALPDADLEKTVSMPWSPEPSTLAELLFMNYWNTVYHIGQVSYVQTLYGDKEMH
jgi:hypothetical protein